MARILGLPRKPAQAETVEISAKWNGRRHGTPPFATMIQVRTGLGIPYDSQLTLVGITPRKSCFPPKSSVAVIFLRVINEATDLKVVVDVRIQSEPEQPAIVRCSLSSGVDERLR